MTLEQMRAALAQRDLELAAAKAALAKEQNRPVNCKIGQKGGLVISGFGRYPISLYLSQFRKLEASWDKVVAFVNANESKFTTLEDKEETTTATK